MISPLSSGLLPFPILLTPKGVAFSFSFSSLSWPLPPGLLPRHTFTLATSCPRLSPRPPHLCTSSAVTRYMGPYTPSDRM